MTDAIRPMIPRFIRHRLGLLRGKVRTSRWRRLKRQRKETTVETRQGRFVVSTSDEVIGRQLYVYRQFELDLMRVTLAYVRERQKLADPADALVIDVGANIGISSIAMVGTLGWARAVAIEPDPYNFGLLERNVALNGLADRIVCVNCAASSTSGTATLTLHRDNFGDHRLNASPDSPGGQAAGTHAPVLVPVPMRRIDDIVAEASPRSARDLAGAMLWMDVQGHELYALQGAPRLIGEGVPTCVEVWPHGLDRWGGGVGEFTKLALAHWDTVVRFGPEGPSEQPIRELPRVIESIGSGEHDYDNVLLLRDRPTVESSRRPN